MMNRFSKTTLALALSLGLAACSDVADESDLNALRDEVNSLRGQLEDSYFQLQLLHLADMDGSNADALANVGNTAAILAALTADYPNNTLFLSSGDNYIPGSRYTASADASFSTVTGVVTPGVGRADIAFLNAMGLQASAVGNHDLDGGTAEFAGLISPDANWVGAQFPYLSSNLDFTPDANLAALVEADGQDPTDIPGKLASSVVVLVDGERIGIVGASTPTLENITSTGDIAVLPASDSTEELAQEIQTAVDALTAEGINKIILLAHMQRISVEQELATLLKNVDIIVAGGSNTLLADSNDRLRVGDSAADTYPLMATSASDEPVLVVNTDADYKYLGRLVVSFNSSGRIVEDTLDSAVNGAYVTDSTMVDALSGTRNATVDGIVDAVNAVLIDQEGNILGNTAVYLNGVRGSVRSEETNLGNLTADANLWYAQQYDATAVISLKNGGGIRADIGSFAYPPGSTDAADLEYYPPEELPAAGKEAGDVSQFDIQSALAFNNGLTLVDVTAQELKDIIEHGITTVGAGAFPQIGGMSFTYDPNATAGSRVESLSVGATAVVTAGVVDSGQGPFRMVTLNFLAGGGDGYPIPQTNRVDLVLDAGVATSVDMSADDPGQADFAATGSEQDALAEYLLQFHPDAASAFDLADTIASDAVTDTRIVVAP